MSFYDDASIVLIPSGYKASKLYSAKPTDGAGDLSFTRTGSTATRVNESGLIEECRTNVITYSQDFSDSSWTKAAININTSATINPINSALTAQDAIPTAVLAIHRIFKTTGIINTQNTWSIYAKSKGYDFIRIVENGNSSAFVSFNLSNGTISSQSGGVGKIESLADGWYRCSMTHNTATGPRFDIYVSPTDSAADYTANGTSGVILFGAQAETGDIATAYIPTTSAAVTVGPVANLPRLDYTGGGCPKLLMEPTRTNVALYSEQFDNAYWTKSNTTISANNILSLDGYVNADKIIEDTATSTHFFSRSINLNAENNTFSIFAKSAGRNLLLIRNQTIGLNATFNLSNGTLGTVQSPMTAKIDNFGNGWYRCSVTFLAIAGLNNIRSYITNSDNSISSYLGDGISGLYLYGAQLEAGAYATSYIPTLNATVTRNADSASKTGISSLIGQTEGTLFAEIKKEQNGYSYFSISDGTPDNWIFVGQDADAPNRVRGFVRASGILYADINTGIVSNGIIKMAIAYKSNDVVLYVNGTLIGSDNSVVIPSSITSFSLTGNVSAISSLTLPIIQSLVFKTRLSNADLATLTTL